MHDAVDPSHSMAPVDGEKTVIPACANELSRPRVPPKLYSIRLRGLSQIPLLLGVFGASLLAAGADAPLIHIPIVGTLSYLRHPAYFTACSIGEIVILASAALSAVFTLLKWFRLLWFTGGVAIVQLIATLAIFEHDATMVMAKADQPDLVDPILMWAGSALQHARFEWGIGIVAGGAAVVLAAAAWHRGGAT
jgi:hypothetical protein